MHRLTRRLTPYAPHVERAQSTERPAPSRVRQRGATSQLRFDPRERWQISMGIPDERCIDVDLRQDPDHSTGPARALECPRRRHTETSRRVARPPPRSSRDCKRASTGPPCRRASPSRGLLWTAEAPVDDGPSPTQLWYAPLSAARRRTSWAATYPWRKATAGLVDPAAANRV